MKSDMLLLGQIEAAEQTLRQTSEEKVHSAVNEFGAMVCHMEESPF